MNKMKTGDLVKVKPAYQVWRGSSFHRVVEFPSPSRVVVKPVDQVGGQGVSVPLSWVILVNPDDYGHLDTRAKRTSAYQLIQSAGKFGLTYDELKPLHLHGAPSDLIRIGMLHRVKRPNGKWAYTTARVPRTSGRTFFEKRYHPRSMHKRSNFHRGSAPWSATL
jgi:hypothetical protein